MISLKSIFLKARVGFHFYKKLAITSAGLTILLIFLRNPIEATLLIKMVFLALVFAWFKFFDPNDKLLFYKNFGITPESLFIYNAFLDFLLSVFLYKLANLIL